MNKIMRMADVELRKKEDRDMSVEGIACVFDTETDIGGWFFEKIDKHAFDDCDMSDVYCLFNHDDNYPLARTLNGSLKLSVDDKGLHQEADIISTSIGNDVYKMVRENLINKMSFAFTIDADGGEEWSIDEDGYEHRVIKKINKLYDVSLVTYPSYSTTEAFARNVGSLDELAKKHIEERNMNEEVIVEATPEVAPIEENCAMNEENSVDVAEVVETKEEAVVEEAPVEETKEEIKEEKEERKEMNTNFEVKEVREMPYNSTPEYRSAWIKAIVGKGDADLNAIKEARGLTTASATLVPTYIADKVQHTWERNRLLNEVSIIFSTAKLSFPVETANSGAVFHTEGAEAPVEESITLVDKLLQPMTAKKWISITDELINGSEEAIMDYIADEVAYYILKLVADSVINGSLVGGKGVEGIVNSSLAEAVTGGALDGTTFYKGLATLIDVEAPVIVMNPTDFYGKVMGLLDTTGRPIFSAIGTEMFVNGCRVILSNAVPTNKAIVGDLSAYKLEMEAREPRLIFDPYTSAREDKVNVIGKLMVGGALVKAHKLAVVSFTA